MCAPLNPAGALTPPVPADDQFSFPFRRQSHAARSAMSSILRAAQRELKRHSMRHFVDNSPSIAQGGSGVVVSGCEACGKVIYTRNGFVEHLANDVLPRILETAFSMATKFVYCRD